MYSIKEKIYCCIDLKSFYASVECVDRGLDPFTTNLVVADPDRKDGTICLAVTPAMKKLGVKNRCRLFEIPKNIEYIIAKPRMKLYMDKSAEIFSIYLRFISADDIHIYSVDECFIDLTDYVSIYDKNPKELAVMLTEAVKKQTGICATVGIGTNLFLAKVALDITAKHSSDFTGYLDEDLFKKTIWHHRPITDIWNIGKGTAKRLEKYNIFDLHGITVFDEDKLYKEFGINAELLIDHANGVEPCTIKDIHSYKSKQKSISNGQVLFEDYTYLQALDIIREMTEQLVLEMVENDLICNNISLYIGYSDKTKKPFSGSFALGEYTDSFEKIINHIKNYLDKAVEKNSMIRKINIGLNNLIEKTFSVYGFFDNVVELNKENTLLKTVVKIKNKYGKNSLLKGTSFKEKATARERNKMIGGHNAGQED